jgi:hypothetical protein
MIKPVDEFKKLHPNNAQLPDFITKTIYRSTLQTVSQ